jgi:hypothetical protein
MPYPLPGFKFNSLIICEGPEDKAFFERLIEANKLPPCHIETTGEARKSSGGNTRFGMKLKAIRIRRDFDQLTNIIIVTDADNCAQNGASCRNAEIAWFLDAGASS